MGAAWTPSAGLGSCYPALHPGTSKCLLPEFCTNRTDQSRELTANWLWSVTVLQVSLFPVCVLYLRRPWGFTAHDLSASVHLMPSHRATPIYQAWKWSRSPEQMIPFSTYGAGIGLSVAMEY